MATYTFAQVLTKLNTKLRDTSNTTFTNAEKTEILTEVIENDPYCCKIAVDTSLSTGSTVTVSWTIPTGVEDVIDFGVDYNANGIPEYLDRSAWDVIDGTIYLTDRYYSLALNKTIYLNVKKRLTTSDSIPDYLVMYALEIAQGECFELLSSVLGERFLKNDMTMAELQAKIAAHERKAAKYRSTLPNKRLIVV